MVTMNKLETLEDIQGKELSQTERRQYLDNYQYSGLAASQYENDPELAITIMEQDLSNILNPDRSKKGHIDHFIAQCGASARSELYTKRQWTSGGLFDGMHVYSGLFQEGYRQSFVTEIAGWANGYSFLDKEQQKQFEKITKKYKNDNLGKIFDALKDEQNYDKLSEPAQKKLRKSRLSRDKLRDYSMLHQTAENFKDVKLGKALGEFKAENAKKSIQHMYRQLATAA